MSRVTELEKALTTLFRKGTEVGYTETEIDEFLENIDYHALLQAVWNKAETVYPENKKRLCRHRGTSEKETGGTGAPVQPHGDCQGNYRCGNSIPGAGQSPD